MCEKKGVEFETQQARKKEIEEEKLEKKKEEGRPRQLFPNLDSCNYPGDLPESSDSRACSQPYSFSSCGEEDVVAPESNESQNQNRKLSLDDDAQSGLGTFQPQAKKRVRKQGTGSSWAGACIDPGGRLWCCLRYQLLSKKIAHLQQQE